MKPMTWPIPALLAWSTSWLCFKALLWAGAPEGVALLVATLWGGVLTVWASTTMRRALVALGFPLSVMASSASLSVSPWAWLGLLALVLVIYPRSAWRDAPLFPTPRKALRDVSRHIQLPAGAHIVDAGSGLGDGLIALRGAFAQAQLHGIEMSWLLRVLSALRCPYARVRQGDIWLADWGRFDMVYLFQRPESMPRAVAKAQSQLRPGAWLVSLEFEARELQPQAVVYGEDGRPVWLYQLPFQRR